LALSPAELDLLSRAIGQLRESSPSGPYQPAVGEQHPPPEREKELAENAAHIIKHLEASWGKERPCPFCGNTEWLIDPKPVLLSSAERFGVGIPAFLVMCKVCGFEVHISGERAGVYSPASEQEERPEE
jgi:hypothetical protein